MLGTRDYMRARFGFIDSLGRIDTRDAVETQLEHARDMIRLCRADNMGIREFVSFLMLRTVRDQECYDFVKWWFTTGAKPDYDWGNMNLGFLDGKDADAFEDIRRLGLRESCGLPHLVALALLKVKILLDLKTLESATDMVPRLNDMPRELFNSVRSLVPRSPIISRNRALMEEPDHVMDILEMELQAYQLYCIVQKINPHFWDVLFNPQLYLARRPAVFARGSLDEAQLVLGYSYRVWVETCGALWSRRGLTPENGCYLLVLLGPVKCRLSTISNHPFPSDCFSRWEGGLKLHDRS